MSEPAKQAKRPHVVIIGSGFGGLFTARKLKRAKVDITLISRTAHHLFQPLLYQVATGILSQGTIAPMTRDILKRQRNCRVLLGEVTDIDVEKQTVTSVLGDGESVTNYDYLVVATGAGPSYFGHDEFEQYAPGVKRLDDALELRGRIFGSFEVAELLNDPEAAKPWLTFAVVGAGPTGVEIAGQINELSRRSLDKNFRNISADQAQVILLDGGDAVLKSFGQHQADKAKEALERMGIDVRLNAKVTDVDTEGLTVEYHDGRTEHIAARCKVWAAGVSASPLAAILGKQTGAEVDRSGRVAVQPDLSLPGHPEIRVIGDMAALDDLPGVAQVAIQGGKYAAKAIKAEINGTPLTEKFKYFDKGSMATISRFRAIANIGKIELRGFIGWLTWLFIHLLYLVGFYQRLATLGHWFVAFIGRGRTERTFTSFQARGISEMLQITPKQARVPGTGLEELHSQNHVPLQEVARDHNEADAAPATAPARAADAVADEAQSAKAPAKDPQTPSHG